jgi:hypothetical protein
MRTEVAPAGCGAGTTLTSFQFPVAGFRLPAGGASTGNWKPDTDRLLPVSLCLWGEGL